MSADGSNVELAAPLTGDSDAAIDFLFRWEASGPWVLTAIVPGDQAAAHIETRTFRPNQNAELGKWLDSWQGKANLYFSVNRPNKDLTDKATKEDIGWLIALHVDDDPRAGEDLAAERARILAKAQSFRPVPSIIVDSGGGYQSFWLLKEPVKIEDAAKLELYNKQLEILFSADHCFNIDRIMRLPGTINLPNKKKLAKGRKRALASIVQADWTLRYDLSEFSAAPADASVNGSGVPVKISGNLANVDLDELPAAVPDWVKAVILHGDDPTDATRYSGDRSKAVFGVACGLVRAGCTDDTIAGILLDEDYAISGHVRDQPNPTKYTERQIRRAREYAIAPELAELNADFSVVNEEGKTRIFEERLNDAFNPPRWEIKRWSFESFRDFHCDRFVEVGTDAKGRPITQPLGKWWLANPNRRKFKDVVFKPRGNEKPQEYNLWRGFSCDAVPGDWGLYRTHLFENICSGNQEHYDYLIRWMARGVQQPDAQGEVAVVLRGIRGAGKGVFTEGYGRLFGQHYLQVSNAKHLTGQFNAHLRDCVVLFADEAFLVGDKTHEAVLKTLITEGTNAVEAKGVDLVQAPNYVHLIMASNSDWVIPAGYRERRFFVLDVSDKKAQDHDYFAAIKKQLGEGGRAAMLHDLRNVDLSGFQVRRVPQTEALIDQQRRSLDPIEQWWLSILESGELPGATERAPRWCATAPMLEAARASSFELRYLGDGTLSTFLTANKDDKGLVGARRHRPTGKGPRGHLFNALGECRRRWTEKHRWQGTWGKASATDWGQGRELL
jgi:hypothetical protein